MHSLKIAVASLLVSVSVPAGAAEIAQSGFSPLYVGVDTETATVPSNPTSAGLATTSRAYIVRIDLSARGIGFIATPQSGSLNTTSEPTSLFAAEHRVRIAINANFFAPCCDRFAEPKTVWGLLVSQGKVVSPAYSANLGSYEGALAITRDNHAVIAEASAIDLNHVYTAVAGSGLVLREGQDVSATSGGDPGDPNPRTLAGLTKDGRFLYLAVIDGRLTGYSTGTTGAQSAALMLALGCYNALNLDGGGSSEMVSANVLGTPYVLTTPSGGAERYDAAALGVYALPLDRSHEGDRDERREGDRDERH
jgi:exopolysaccharide biosynthesis protein